MRIEEENELKNFMRTRTYVSDVYSSDRLAGFSQSFF